VLKRLVIACAIAAFAGDLLAHERQVPAPPAASTYLVFLMQRPVGREEVVILNDAEGWLVRGSSQLGVPVEVTTRHAEVRYDNAWHPRSLTVEGIVGGDEVRIKTTFANGSAVSEITTRGETQQKTDRVAEDTVVLPNTFLGSYAALARRLRGLAANAEIRAYIAPQAEIPIRIVAVSGERIETAREAITASRYTLRLVNPGPPGELDATVWIDDRGQLLRIHIPGQQLELVRDDIASSATRTTAFSLPGDERVTIPSSGFNIAGTLTKPSGGAGRLPAVVLIAGSGQTDRDETVAGIPVFGHLARGLAEAGFVVVRYDKRGVGQSGGRAESATLSDFAEDARAVVRWLERRPDVDKDRLAALGHSEGAAVAMLLASREKRVKAAVLVAGPGTTGADLILEQQRHQLDVMKVDSTDRAAKIALQEQIHAAVLKGSGWEGVPDQMRRAADTPWFQSLLSFDPAKVMKDVEQPLLIVQGELDTQVPPHHADKLVALAEARKKNPGVQLMKVPGINHLLVPAKTGEVSEYGSLRDAEVAPSVPVGIGAWLAKTLGAARK